MRVKKKNIYLIIAISIITIIIVAAVFADFITKFNYADTDIYNLYAKPDRLHILGTDGIGRDIWARLLYGARVSVAVALIATFMQLLLGLTLGLTAAYFGKVYDFIIMRIIDVMMCFPYFLTAIAVSMILKPSFISMVIVIALLSWTDLARLVRVQTLSLKNRDFVKLSESIGFSKLQILRMHILPNLYQIILVSSTVSMANAVLLEASLSFLGIGIKDPLPSWGNMLSEAVNIRSLQSYWWSWLPAGICVTLLVLSIYFIGEYFRIKQNPFENNILGEKIVAGNVDISFEKGNIYALVGESGSGKTMTGLSILHLLPKNIEVRGSILYEGENLLSISDKEMLKRRGNKIAMIFQEPIKALNPLFKVGHQIEEVLKIHTKLNKRDRKAKVLELISGVMLDNPKSIYHKYPHELSGGMRQRIAIAMAIACNPDILIADEPTTAVDAGLKKDIAKLIVNLSKKHNITVLYISHDLNTVEEVADYVWVIYKGEIIERKSKADFFKQQDKDYSKKLMDFWQACSDFDSKYFQTGE